MSIKTSKYQKPVILIILLTGVAVIAITLMLWATGQSGEQKNREVIYAELEQYDPQNMVVPPHLIGDAKGTLKNDLIFDPLGVISEAGDVAEASYGGTIPSGTQYFAVLGYEDKGCIGIEYGGNYFLYRPMPFYASWPLVGDTVDRISFSQIDESTEVSDRLRGSNEQACMEALKVVSEYKADYLVLGFSGSNLDNYDDLIAIYQEYCEQRGVTLLLNSDGYIEENSEDWGLDGGVLLISLDGADFDGDSAYIGVGVVAGSLAGSGYSVNLEKQNGDWVVIDTFSTWIS